MGSKSLSNRGVWQDIANSDGLKNEKSDIESLKLILNKLYPSRFQVCDRKSIPFLKNGIKYHDDEKYNCRLDSCIIDNTTGKVLLVESKKQGEKGNAHERVYKYLPGGGISARIKKFLTTSTGILHDKHPVVFIFSGGISKKSKYLTELKAQCKGYEHIYHMFDSDITKFTKFVKYFVNNYFDDGVWIKGNIS